MISTVEMALRAAAAGAYVFPLLPNKKTPPRDMHFKEMATRDPAVIRHWFADTPDMNYGIYCGRWGYDQALVVVDVDNKPGRDGMATLRELRRDYQLDDTFTVSTPTGGLHLYYIVEQPLRGGTDRLGLGIDVKSHGGYVVGPGSKINGKMYTVVE